MALLLTFWILTIIALTSAMVVVIAKNPITSVLNLIVCFFAVAGHYVLLSAQFLAVVNIIIYAGAIIVLFLFVIMLMNLNVSGGSKPWRFKLLAAAAAGLVLVSLAAAVRGWQVMPPAVPVDGTVKALGRWLFNAYLVPFELSAVVFLSAMVGAVLIGKKHPQEETL